jgi:hypothetical protein
MRQPTFFRKKIAEAKEAQYTGWIRNQSDQQSLDEFHFVKVVMRLSGLRLTWLTWNL